jgi:hypothetical protein
MRATWALSSILVAVAACGSSSNDPPSDAATGVAKGDGSSDMAGDAPGEAAGVEASPAVPYCGGFVMPNPAKAGLPNPASYTANGDGTITDGVTGLIWEGTPGSTTYMLSDAVTHCAGKGGTWHLPTRLELVSLVDYTIGPPGPTINPIFMNTYPSTFWTSSAYYGDAGDEWYVGFDAGYSDYGIVNQSCLVRCVQAPAPKCFTPRYQTQADSTVLDQATGLRWEGRLNPGSFTWSDALKYCAGLGAGWRAPSLTEIQTIIDEAQEDPAVDPTAFPNTPAVDFWTSTAKADGTGAAWYVDFFYGASDSDVPAKFNRVRCVR